MPSILLKLGDLGFTAQGCYREGDCESCHVTGLTWFWHGSWRCDTCVLNSLLPEDKPNPHQVDYTDRSAMITAIEAGRRS